MKRSWDSIGPRTRLRSSTPNYLRSSAGNEQRNLLRTDKGKWLWWCTTRLKGIRPPPYTEPQISWLLHQWWTYKNPNFEKPEIARTCSPIWQESPLFNAIKGAPYRHRPSTFLPLNEDTLKLIISQRHISLEVFCRMTNFIQETLARRAVVDPQTSLLRLESCIWMGNGATKSSSFLLRNWSERRNGRTKANKYRLGIAFLPAFATCQNWRELLLPFHNSSLIGSTRTNFSEKHGAKNKRPGTFSPFHCLHNKEVRMPFGTRSSSLSTNNHKVTVEQIVGTFSQKSCKIEEGSSNYVLISKRLPTGKDESQDGV